jgi:dihydropteroate synthase
MQIRLIRIENQSDAAKQIRKIGAYPESIKYMSPKCLNLTVKLKDISAVAANILKQEMLSAGGDAAVSKEAITKNVKRTDCLVFGNISHLKKLVAKLKEQPLGLDKIAEQIQEVVSNYKKEKFIFKCRNRSFDLTNRVLICGVLNITPDSFSDGGNFFDLNTAYQRGISLSKDGADIIDIGGESTRPGAVSVSAAEQIKRVVPVIKKLSEKIKTPISIDTRNYKVAEAAIKAGASIINDISGLKSDKKIAKIAAKYKTGLILMHIKGTPKNMQNNPQYDCLMQEIISSLNNSIRKAQEAGVAREQILIDPGIGFGKTTDHNLSILRNLFELRSLGYPIMIGTSRKSVIGNILNKSVDKRLMGTAATVVYSILQGAQVVRVHDVKPLKDVVKITQAIKNKA